MGSRGSRGARAGDSSPRSKLSASRNRPINGLMTPDPRVWSREQVLQRVEDSLEKVGLSSAEPGERHVGLPMNGRNTQPIWAPTRANTITQRLNTVLTCLPRTRFGTGSSALAGPRCPGPRCSMPGSTPTPARATARSTAARTPSAVGVPGRLRIQNAQPVQRLEQERQPECP